MAAFTLLNAHAPRFFRCGGTVGMTLNRDLLIYAANELKANPTWEAAIDFRSVVETGYVEVYNPNWMTPLTPDAVDAEIALVEKQLADMDSDCPHNDDTENDIPF